MRLIVLTLLALIPHFQQPATNNNIVTYSVCCSSDLAVEQANRFMQEAQVKLEQAGIHVQILRIEVSAEPKANTLGHVNFQEEFNGEHIIVDTSIIVYPERSPLFILSPILTESVPVGNHIGEFDSEVIPAILAYTAGNCNLLNSLPPVFNDPINFYRGNCALIDGDYETAITRYELACPDPSGHPCFEPTTNSAWAYLQLDKPDAAFDVMDAMIEDYKTFGGWYSEYRAYLWANESERRKIVKALVKRSQLYALAFRYTEAIADMDAAIELAPDNPELYVERGQRIILTYDWDRALADYNHALELDPDYADAYYYRGILYASVPEGADARRLALDDFRHYLELAPSAAHAADAAQYAAELQAQLDALASLG